MEKQDDFSGSQNMQPESSQVHKSESKASALGRYRSRTGAEEKPFKWSMPSTVLGIWSTNAAWEPTQQPGGPLLLAPSISEAVKEGVHPRNQKTQNKLPVCGNTLVSLLVNLAVPVSEVNTQSVWSLVELKKVKKKGSSGSSKNC